MSRVLNGQRNPRPETRDRVQAAIETLHSTKQNVLIQSFISHALTYLERPSFPRSFIRSRLKEGRPVPVFLPRASHV